VKTEWIAATQRIEREEIEINPKECPINRTQCAYALMDGDAGDIRDVKFCPHYQHWSDTEEVKCAVPNSVRFIYGDR